MFWDGYTWYLMSSCYSSSVADFVQYTASFSCPHKWQLNHDHVEHWTFSLKFVTNASSCYTYIGGSVASCCHCLQTWHLLGFPVPLKNYLTLLKLEVLYHRFLVQTSPLATRSKCQESAFTYDILFISHLNFCAWFTKIINIIWTKQV